MWAVLRIRIPKTDLMRSKPCGSLGLDLVFSLLMLFAIQYSGVLFQWDAIWRLTTWDELADPDWFWRLTGVGYFFTRGFVRLWLRWDRMRKKRMLWTITNALLMVAIFFAFLAAVLVFLVTPYSSTAQHIWEQTRDPFASFVTGLLVTFFPALTIIVVGMAVTLFA